MMKRLSARMVIFFVIALVIALPQAMATGEPLAVIINPKNLHTNISRASIASMYRGEELHWPTGGRIKLVNREISSISRKQFYRTVLNAKPDQTFYRPGTPVAVQSLIQRSDEAVIRFVAAIEGAIGYVRLSRVTDSVTVIQIIPEG